MTHPNPHDQQPNFFSQHTHLCFSKNCHFFWSKKKMGVFIYPLFWYWRASQGSDLKPWEESRSQAREDMIFTFQSPTKEDEVISLISSNSATMMSSSSLDFLQMMMHWKWCTRASTKSTRDSSPENATRYQEFHLIVKTMLQRFMLLGFRATKSSPP